jgi:hypothetical protein
VGEVYIPVFRFTAVSVIPQTLHTHISFMHETNKMPEPSNTTLLSLFSLKDGLLGEKIKVGRAKGPILISGRSRRFCVGHCAVLALESTVLLFVLAAISLTDSTH